MNVGQDVKMLDMARRPQWMPEDDLLLKNAVEVAVAFFSYILTKFSLIDLFSPTSLLLILLKIDR